MGGMSRLIAITGGIGSGKSVVAQLLRTIGFTVYDCDARAKGVMTHDPLLRQQLTALFGPETYLPSPTPQEPGALNKPYLASRIFGDAEALNQMNACVHPAVARDLQAQRAKCRDEVFFYESAILYESGFDQLAPPDEVWTVSAPLEIRLKRAMQRDHAPREQVLNRIEAQMSQEEKERRADHILCNDDQHSLIAQVNLLIKRPCY